MKVNHSAFKVGRIAKGRSISTQLRETHSISVRHCTKEITSFDPHDIKNEFLLNIYCINSLRMSQVTTLPETYPQSWPSIPRLSSPHHSHQQTVAAH